MTGRIPNETIGFVGVGLMGAGMAANLLTASYTVTILGNKNRAPVEDLVARGATEAKTASAVGAASTVVFLCLPGSP
ncbi:MAG: NAD(P)-binding domain-containing protein, partial [Pseudomonadota bacterium]